MIEDLQTWTRQQRTALRGRLQGQITYLACLAGLRVTDIAEAFLRLTPLSPRQARRLAAAYNAIRLPGYLRWQDLVDPCNAEHPAFAPLHPEAVRREFRRNETGPRGGKA